MKGGYADSDILIVSACRTPIGRFCGSLASIPTHELGGCVISECIKRVSSLCTIPSRLKFVVAAGWLTLLALYSLPC